MPSKYPQHLINLLHPYQFALKEGDVELNRLDYSLLLLQITCPEIIKSPLSYRSPYKNIVDGELPKNPLTPSVNVPNIYNLTD